MGEESPIGHDSWVSGPPSSHLNIWAVRLTECPAARTKQGGLAQVSVALGQAASSADPEPPSLPLERRVALSHGIGARSQAFVPIAAAAGIAADRRRSQGARA